MSFLSPLSFFIRSIIAASSTDTTPHALELRAIQDEDNAEPKKVSGFRLDMTNVVAAQINSQVLVFVTDSSVKVLEAKVRTVSDRLIDLIPSSQANASSLTNLPVGIYTLDVMTQKGNTKAAYEGILVISQRPTTIISETTRNVINQEINQNTRVDIDDDDDDVCPAGYKGKPPFCTPKNPCIKNPDLPQCPIDCEANPDDPRCQVEGGDICDENPDAEGCPPRDCDQNPDLPECQEPPPEDVGEGDTGGGDEGDEGGDEGDVGDEGGDEGGGGDEGDSE